MGEDCLREVEVVVEGCLLDNPTRFGAYHRLGFDYQV